MFEQRFVSGHRYRQVFAVTSSLIAASFAGGCRPAPPPAPVTTTVSPDTWASVDGREITREDVDKSYRRSRDASQGLSEEEVMTIKLNLLNDLIVQDILLAKAAALKLAVADSEIDTAFANARKNITDEAFQQELTRRGLTSADMREELRRELLAQKVIDQELGPKLAVTDKEVTAFFDANRAQFNLAEDAYHLAQIVVTPARDPQLTNSTGDDAATPQAAAAKVQMLMERLKAGTSFRSWRWAIPKIPTRHHGAGTWALCRCPDSSRLHRPCATPY